MIQQIHIKHSQTEGKKQTNKQTMNDHAKFYIQFFLCFVENFMLFFLTITPHYSLRTFHDDSCMFWLNTIWKYSKKNKNLKKIKKVDYLMFPSVWT